MILSFDAINLLHDCFDELLYPRKKWIYFLVGVNIFLLILAFRYYITLFIKDRALNSLFSFLILFILPFHFFFPRPYYPNYWYDTPSILFFTLGLIAMYKRKWMIYYFIFIIATFNRETTCFLTVIYLFTSFGKMGENHLSFWSPDHPLVYDKRVSIKIIHE